MLLRVFTILIVLCSILSAKPTKIMVLGSSLTDGSPDQPGYRYYLGKKMQQKGFSFDFVGTRWGVGKGEYQEYSRPTYIKHNLKDFLDWEHEERWGWNAKGILHGCESKKIVGAVCYDQPKYSGRLSDWLDKLDSVGNIPDVVILYIGTNDVAQDSLSEMPETYEKIISTLRSYNRKVKIVWGNLLPNKWDSYGENPVLSIKVKKRVTEINQLIANMSSQLSTQVSPIYLTDLNSGFPWEGGISPDFMMPTRKGLIWIGNQFYETIVKKGVLKKPEIEKMFVITAQTSPPLKGRGYEKEDEEALDRFKAVGMNLMMGFTPTTHNVHDFQGNLYALERVAKVGGLKYMAMDEYLLKNDVEINTDSIKSELKKYGSLNPQLDGLLTGYMLKETPPYKKFPAIYYEIKNRKGDFVKYNSKYVKMFNDQFVKLNFNGKTYIVPQENVFKKTDNSAVVSLFGSYPSLVQKPVSVNPNQISSAEGFAFNLYENKVVSLQDFNTAVNDIVKIKQCEAHLEYPGDSDPKTPGIQRYSTNPWNRFNQLVSTVKNEDPRKRMFVNFYPNVDSIFSACSDNVVDNSYADYVRAWMGSPSSDFGVYNQPLWMEVRGGNNSGVKRWNAEHFGNPQLSYYKTMETWASESRTSSKPWWYTIPSTWDKKSSYILPTLNSLKFYSNSALIYGAKGINWSGYYPTYKGLTNSELAIVNADKTPTILYPLVKNINEYLGEIGQVAKNLEWLETVHGRASCAVTNEDNLKIIRSDTPIIEGIQGAGAKHAAIGIFFNPEDRLNYLMVMNKNPEKSWDISIRFKSIPNSVWKMVNGSGGKWEKIRSADLIYLILEPSEMVFLRLGNNTEHPTVVSPSQPLEIGKNFFWHMTKEQNNKVKIEGNNMGLSSLGDGLLFLRNKNDTSFAREIMIHSIDDGVSMGPMIRNGYGKKASFAYLNVFRKEKYCFVRLESRNSPNGKVEQQMVSSPLRLPIMIRLEFKNNKVIGLVKQKKGRWIKVGNVDYKASQPNMGLAFIGKQDPAMADFSPFDLLESGFNLPSVVYDNSKDSK